MAPAQHLISGRNDAHEQDPDLGCSRHRACRRRHPAGIGADAAALTGQVTSAEEGAMGGVLVSAKKAGSTVTITVVSDAQGNYSFPAAKLEPGQYSLRIRLSATTSIVPPT